MNLADGLILQVLVQLSTDSFCLDYEAEFILLRQLVPRHLPLQWCLWVLCVFSACASLSKLLVSMHLIRGLITAILLKRRMWAST